MEVTRDNFEESFQVFRKVVDTCSFVSCDLEFSGLSMERSTFLDLPEHMYQRSVEAVQKFFPLQVGLTVFLYNRQTCTYDAYPFSFYLFPPEEELLLHSTCVSFLAKNNFDFNKCFASGIRYYSHMIERSKKESILGNETPRVRTAIKLNNAKDEDFLANVKDLLTGLLEKDVDTLKTSDLVDEEFELHEQHDQEEFEGFLFLKNLNPFLRRLVYQTSEEMSSRILCLPFGNRLALRVFESDKAVKKHKEARKKRRLARVKIEAGFRRILDLLKRVPLVLHNGLYDLLYLMRIIDELPMSLDQFKEQVRSSFECVYDTKLMASMLFGEEFDHMSSLAELLETVSSKKVKQIYEISSQCHDAGYDALCTGQVFMGMLERLRGERDFTVIERTKNKLYLARSDFLFLDLSNADIVPNRSNILILKSFPEGWKQNDLTGRFKDRVKRFLWLEESKSAAVMFESEEEAQSCRDLIAKEIEVETWEDYREKTVVTFDDDKEGEVEKGKEKEEEENNSEDFDYDDDERLGNKRERNNEFENDGDTKKQKGWLAAFMGAFWYRVGFMSYDRLPQHLPSYGSLVGLETFLQGRRYSFYGIDEVGYGSTASLPSIDSYDNNNNNNNNNNEEEGSTETESELEDESPKFTSPMWQYLYEEALIENDEMGRNEKILEIFSEFEFKCKLYGGVIISEKHLPDKQKSIKPLDIGGVAGGTKFMCNGILFKFANDVEMDGGLYLYGGDQRNDEAAHKAAGHERKALGEVMRTDVEGLNCPMMTIVDFLGCRLSAQAVVPIEGDKTLVYGSRDGGLSVRAGEDAEEVLPKLKELAEHLGLLEHKVAERSTGVIKDICMPIDIEVHRSTRVDHDFYILDTARLFPPVYPEKDPREIYHRLFRREFLTTYSKKLSSDTLSNFGKLNGTEHAKAVKECTELLLNKHIPKVAKEMENSDIAKKNLSQYLQQAGINLRYLGIVRENTSCDAMRRKMLLEMCLRTIQKAIFKRWREEGISKSNLVVAVELLNEAMVNVDWLIKHVEKKYDGRGVTENDFPLTKSEWRELWFGLRERAGIVISVSDDAETLTVSDVRLEPRVKKLRSVSILEAEALRQEGKCLEKGKERRKKVLHRAETILSRELAGDPSNVNLRLRKIRVMFNMSAGSNAMEKEICEIPHCGELFYFRAKLHRTKACEACSELKIKEAVFHYTAAKKQFETLEKEGQNVEWNLLEEETIRVRKLEKLKAYLESDTVALFRIIRNVKDYDDALGVAKYAGDVLKSASGSSNIPGLFWLCVMAKNTEACHHFLRNRDVLDIADLTYCAFDDKVAAQLIPFLPKDNKVTHLLVKHAIIKDDTLMRLMRCFPSVKRLSMSHCPFLTSKCIPERLESLELEKCLNIDNLEPAKEMESLTVVEGFTVSMNVRFERLRRIDLVFGQPVDRHFVEKLPSCLEVAIMTFASPEAVKYLPVNLRELTATFEGGVHGDGLVFPVLPILKKLHVEKFVKNELLLNVATNSPLLEDLGLSGCFWLDDESVVQALSSLKHIRCLDISDTVLTSKSIPASAKLCELNVLRCGNFVCTSKIETEKLEALQGEQMDDAFILSLRNQLRVLSITRADMLTQECWKHLCECCSGLQHLCLKIGNLEDAELVQMLKSAPNLRSLEISDSTVLLGKGLTSLDSSSLSRLENLRLHGVFSRSNSVALSSLLRPSIKSLSVYGTSPLDFKLAANVCDKLEDLTCQEVIRKEMEGLWISKFGRLQKLCVESAKIIAKSIMPYIHLNGHLHTLVLHHLFLDAPEWEGLSECPVLCTFSFDKGVIPLDHLKNLPLSELVLNVEPKDSKMLHREVSRIPTLRAAVLESNKRWSLRSNRLVPVLRHAGPKKVDDSELLRNAKLLRKYLRHARMGEEFALISYFHDVFSVCSLMKMRKEGFKVICAVTDPKELNYMNDLPIKNDIFEEIGKDEGVYFVNVDFEDIPAFRANVHNILNGEKLKLVSLAQRLPFDNLYINMALFQNVSFTNLLKKEHFEEVYRYYYLRMALMLTSLSTELSEDVRVVCHTVGFSSISETSNPGKTEGRAVFTALHVTVKAMSFLFPRGIISGVVVGAWFPGFRAVSCTNAEAAERMIRTALLLSPEHNGKVVSYTMEVIPP